jgi:inorganic triphosphatase YgiF
MHGDRPDLALFDPDIAAMVHDATGGEALVPRFETRVRRRSGDLSLGPARMEIAIDEGEIVAGERRAPIAECEIELKEGEPVALFSFAARLTHEELRLNPTPKPQRGYLMARGGGPAEVRATQLNLSPEAPAEEAIGAVVEATLAHFLGNWPALPNAGFKPFRSEAKRIGGAFGQARDQDAYAALLAEGPLSVFPHDESFEALLEVSGLRRS